MAYFISMNIINHYTLVRILMPRIEFGIAIWANVYAIYENKRKLM